MSDIAPATIGLIISIVWLLNRLGWLSFCGKNIKDEYGVIIPSTFVLISPFVFTYVYNLFANEEVIDIFRAVLPVATFVLGQTFNRHNQKIVDNTRKKSSLLAFRREIEVIEAALVVNCNLIQQEMNSLKDRKRIKRLHDFSDIDSQILEFIRNSDFPAESSGNLTGEIINLKLIIRNINYLLEVRRHLNKKIKSANQLCENIQANPSFSSEEIERRISDTYLPILQKIQAVNLDAIKLYSSAAKSANLIFSIISNEISKLE